MINRFNISIIILFIAFSTSNAQNPGRRWAELFNNNEKEIFIDTTSIRQIDNQLTIWSLLVYHEPQQKENIDKEVKKIKTQYLINTLTKRYAIIGSLFYDDRGRIVGESSIARFSGNNQLTQLVADNPVVSIIMEAGKNYVENGNISVNNYDAGVITDYDENNEDIQKPTVDYNKRIDTTPVSNEAENSEVTEDDSSENDSSTEDTDSEVEDNDNGSTPPITSRSYNDSQERAMGGMIFSDGKVFVFQLSAWKDKTEAEREIRRLKNQGHNAFMTEAYIPQKGGTWYRVRIGYFNSYNEARNYKRSMK